MMALDDPGYDNSYKPPDWWLSRVISILEDSDWTHGTLAKQASLVDGRSPKKWGADRVTKLIRNNAGTIQFVTAISKVLKLPPPIFEPANEKEAAAFERWIDASRRRQSGSADIEARGATIERALTGAVADAKDQTRAVHSENEGSPRDPRTRRAPRGGT